MKVELAYVHVGLLLTRHINLRARGSLAESHCRLTLTSGFHNYNCKPNKNYYGAQHRILVFYGKNDIEE